MPCKSVSALISAAGTKSVNDHGVISDLMRQSAERAGKAITVSTSLGEKFIRQLSGPVRIIHIRIVAKIGEAGAADIIPACSQFCRHIHRLVRDGRHDLFSPDLQIAICALQSPAQRVELNPVSRVIPDDRETAFFAPGIIKIAVV